MLNSFDANRLKALPVRAEEKEGKPSAGTLRLSTWHRSIAFNNWVAARAKPLSLTVVLALLSACGDLQIPGTVARQDVRPTPVQSCAIGYDLAAQIYKRVVLSKTIIIPGANPSGCEAHTLTYLRRAGFKIDETAAGPAMTVDLSAGAPGSVAAIATITLGGAGSLRIGRSYSLAKTGVYPQGAVSFITLPDGAGTRRPRTVVSISAPRGDR